MLKKFLRDAVAIIVGKQADEIVNLLDTKKHVNEFLIAKKLNITINQARNILYRLSDYGLVSSIRKKDKKKGWYTYFWRIETLKSLEFMEDVLQKRIEQIENQIKSRETKQFYVCERCHIELAEENALLYDFTCSECGGVFTLKDNTKLLRELKRQLEKLSAELNLVREEIAKEKKTAEKAKERKIAKKKKEREAAKAAKKKEAKKKSVKKAVKKTVKKAAKKAVKAAKKKVKKKSSAAKKAVKSKKKK